MSKKHGVYHRIGDVVIANVDGIYQDTQLTADDRYHATAHIIIERIKEALIENEEISGCDLAYAIQPLLKSMANGLLSAFNDEIMGGSEKRTLN